jgi:ribosome-associated protein
LQNWFASSRISGPREAEIEKALDLAHLIVDTLEERKGEDIVLMDLSQLEAFTDYFVICSGPSERTLRALSEEVQKRVKQTYQLHASSVEGESGAGWILLDYSSVIVHIFAPPVRAYYQLEELWKDSSILLRIQ